MFDTWAFLHQHPRSKVRQAARHQHLPAAGQAHQATAGGDVRAKKVRADHAQDFEIPIWHGWELLDKMRSAKMVSNELVREIYEALERNGDLTRTWAAAKHTTFARVFGGKPG